MVDTKMLLVVRPICMGAIMLFLMYYIIAPSIFFEKRTAEVRCPIVGASTITTKQDGGGETSRRRVETKCDYSAIGYEPRAFEKLTLTTRFDAMADEQPAVMRGDSFVCTATWREYSPLALVTKGTYNDARFDLDSCRIAPR